MAGDDLKYEPAWDRFRAVERAYHRRFLACFLISFGGALLLLAADRAFPHSDLIKGLVGAPLVLAMLVIWLLTMWSGWQVSHLPCPRCGDRFYGRWGTLRRLGRNCAYCGLFIYQAKD